MLLQEAAHVLNARSQGENVLFTGVSTDSRTLKIGDLFVALSGERFEGYRFIHAAKNNGAVAAMVGMNADDEALSAGISFIQVNDTRKGLGQLAAFWRARFSMPLVAVTGSNGKTTVKDMLAAILCQAITGANGFEVASSVLATEGNLNNDIGMPLMLLRMRDTHRYAVIEMGMNHMGEIAYLTELAKPDVAVVTNAGLAHIQGLGTVKAVARAKGEIFSGLDEQGIAVINADDPHASLWRMLAGGRRIINFGLGDQTRRVQVSAEYQTGGTGSLLQLRLLDEVVDVSLKVPGVHNIRNALAAAAAAVAINIDGKAIAAGLGNFKGVRGRLQRKIGLHHAALIDDSYNANPESVRAALSVLAAEAGKKILVLGDMGELGKASIELHRMIGEEARRANLDRLLTLGELSKFASDAFGQGAEHFSDVDKLLDVAESLLAKDVTLLVKGSRLMRMERIIDRLEA